MFHDSPSQLRCQTCGIEKPISDLSLVHESSPTSTEVESQSCRLTSRGEATLAGVMKSLTESDLRSSLWVRICRSCTPRDELYVVELDQCDTPEKALEWVVHLNEKRWEPIVIQSFIDQLGSLFQTPRIFRS
jgi:hypothetical protein